MQKLSLKKGEIIQRQGDIHHKIYFVESGLLRSYAMDKNGKESIFMFAPEGWTIADANGDGIPAELFIEALEDSTVTAAKKEIKREEKNIAPILKRLSVLQKRIIMLQSSSVIDRYNHFIETYPDIVQRVPQRMIASYLGVTPETLSAAKSASRKKQSTP